MPSVTFAPVGKVQVKPGGAANVQTGFSGGFRVSRQFQSSEIGTADTYATEAHRGPVQVSVVSLKYPAGRRCLISLRARRETQCL